MSTINCKDLTKKYGELQVIHGFDLDIQDQEFIVFLGPSGCGKSTIMRMLAGLEEITSGQLHIGGENMTETPAGERGVAMVFQNYALYPHMTVYKNIEFGLRRQSLSKKEIKERINNVVKMLHLEPYLGRKPAQMSGGQQQRVAIARAIVKTPNVFLFDEPLSNLDAKLRHQLRVEIALLHRELKTTTIFVTHDQLEAMTLADRIVLMNAGNVEQIGTPKQIYTRPRTMFVADFIGSPSMNFIEGNTIVNKGNIKVETLIGDLLFNVDLLKDDVPLEVTIGIRPQNILIENMPNEENVFLGKTIFVEYLGNETMATVSCNNVDFNIILPNTSTIEEGEDITFSFDAEHVHFFSTSTGLRLNNDS